MAHGPAQIRRKIEMTKQGPRPKNDEEIRFRLIKRLVKGQHMKMLVKVST